MASTIRHGFLPMKNLQELAQCASGGPMQLQLAEEAVRRGRKTWGFSCFFFFSKETYIKWSTMVNPGINPNIDWLIILGCTTLRAFRTHVFLVISSEKVRGEAVNHWRLNQDRLGTSDTSGNLQENWGIYLVNRFFFPVPRFFLFWFMFWWPCGITKSC
jgi:hypothetical protein